MDATAFWVFEILDVPSWIGNLFKLKRITNRFKKLKNKYIRRKGLQTRCMQIFEPVTNETACNSIFPAHVLTSRMLLQYSSKGTSSSIKGSKSSRCAYKRNVFQLFKIKHHIFVLVSILSYTTFTRFLLNCYLNSNGTMIYLVLVTQ